jgi:hypothetical protein
LRAAKGDTNALVGFESLLDVGNNAFLVGGEKLVEERHDIAMEALSAMDANENGTNTDGNGTGSADAVAADATA